MAWEIIVCVCICECIGNDVRDMAYIDKRLGTELRTQPNVYLV